MITIHDMAEARTALADGLSGPVEMITAPGLVARAGIPWMQQVTAALRTEFPDKPFVLVLDCGQDAARVMEAIHAGLGPISYTGPAERLAKLSAMGDQVNITVLPVAAAS